MDTDITKRILSTLSVAIVDDHEMVLEGFKSFMMRNGMKHVESFLTAHAFLDSISARDFDIYIIDVELTDMDVSVLIDEIRLRNKKAKIIINTMHEEMWVVRKMTEKEVDGIIYKSGELDQLLQAIICVANGNQYYCERFHQMQSHINASNETLSKREHQVLLAIARGLSSKEIAKEMFITENTVETHRQKIFSKMGAHNMADLIIKAIAQGYIDPMNIEE